MGSEEDLLGTSNEGLAVVPMVTHPGASGKDRASLRLTRSPSLKQTAQLAPTGNRLRIFTQIKHLKNI